MVIRKETVINASIQECWNVLGTDFANAYKWASVIKHSEGSGNSFNGASCSSRGCDVKGMGKLKEDLTHFSDETNSLTYEIVEGMPSMVKKGTNSWKLDLVTPNKTKLIMEMNMEIRGLIGTIMQPMMKMQMGSMGNQLIEELKFYIEKGQPHPRKIKAQKGNS